MVTKKTTAVESFRHLFRSQRKSCAHKQQGGKKHSTVCVHKLNSLSNKPCCFYFGHVIYQFCVLYDSRLNVILNYGLLSFLVLKLLPISQMDTTCLLSLDSEGKIQDYSAPFHLLFSCLQLFRPCPHSCLTCL